MSNSLNFIHWTQRIEWLRFLNFLKNNNNNSFELIVGQLSLIMKGIKLTDFLKGKQYFCARPPVILLRRQSFSFFVTPIKGNLQISTHLCNTPSDEWDTTTKNKAQKFLWTQPYCISPVSHTKSLILDHALSYNLRSLSYYTQWRHRIIFAVVAVPYCGGAPAETRQIALQHIFYFINEK